MFPREKLLDLRTFTKAFGNEARNWVRNSAMGSGDFGHIRADAVPKDFRAAPKHGRNSRSVTFKVELFRFQGLERVAGLQP